MNKPLSHKFARIVSTLFVPPSFTIIIFTIFAFTLEDNFTKEIVTILTAIIFGFLLHIILFVHFRNKGKLIDLDASIKEERTVPFLIATVFYVIGLLVFLYFKINIISIAFWFCYISNTLLIIVINKYWKISAHAMAAAGPVAALTIAYGPQYLFLFLLVILIGWSRIKLKCHTIAQVTAGALLGFVSTFVQMVLIINIFTNG